MTDLMQRMKAWIDAGNTFSGGDGEEPPTETDVAGALERALGVGPAPVEETPAAEPAAPEDPAGEPEPPKYTVSGRGYKDEDELVKALENANTLISSRQEPAPTPEPVDEPDPWEHIAGIPQQYKDDLYKLALDDPIAAGKWAWENREQLPDEIFEQVVANAALNKPAQWALFQNEQYRSYAEQVAQQSTERFAIAEQNNIAKSAEAELRAELGVAYDSYEPRINERIVAGQYVAPPKGTPVEDAVKQVFRNIYKDLWLEDNWAALQATLAGTTPTPAAAPAATPAVAPTPVPSAATAAPGGSAPPAPPEDSVDAALARIFG